jgi:hypothetical protein
MDGTEAHINFDASAVHRKCPSLGNQRTEDAAPYRLVDGTLYECLREFMTKPTTQPPAIVIQPRECLQRPKPGK